MTNQPKHPTVISYNRIYLTCWNTCLGVNLLALFVNLVASTIIETPKSLAELSFDKLTANFSEDEVCNIDIDLFNIKSKLQYIHCRAIAGYVSLRHHELLSDEYYPEEKVTFPNLEVIKDFLLLYDIYSNHEHASLSRVFPSLTHILGHRRADNMTLYISHYSASAEIELPKLKTINGPVKIEDSPGLCIKYSPIYWNIGSKHANSKYFSKLPVVDNKDIRVYSRSSEGITARLNIHYSLGKHNDIKFKYLQRIHVSIFELDAAFYHFVEHGNRMQTKCHEPLRPNTHLVLSNFNYTEKLVFSRFHYTNHSTGELSHASSFMTGHKFITESPVRNSTISFDNRTDNYDIIHTTNFAIDSFNSEGLVSMQQGYEFKWMYKYLVKVELCYGKNYHSCRFLYQMVFEPNSKDFKQSILGIFSNFSFAGWSAVVIIVVAISCVVLVLVLLTNKTGLKSIYMRSRLKSLGVDVISVNPEYGLINRKSNLWSWPALINIHSPLDKIKCEINRSKLLILPQRLLGKGEFGFVYEGILFDYDPANGYHCTCNGHGNNGHYSCQNSIRVAIKQLKEDAGWIDKEKFITEAKYMKTFDSNFLVKLIGISTIQEPILVVMEYMENGDLKRFLRHQYMEYQKKHHVSSLLSYEGIVRIAIQIADGMHYLHSKKVIHRDLAARNCMVSSDLTIKIGDFGLTRDLYEKDYYRLSEEAPMPLRWMAPESVRKMIFTPATDVWSYGVVLWEIMCFGEQPFKGKPDLEVKRLISNGTRLPKPYHFFAEIWKIAKKCWHKKPNRRPTFETIIDSLYPQLSNREQFDTLSYYVANKANYRQGNMSLSQIISEHCLKFMSKFCHPSRQHQYQSCRRNTDSSIQTQTNHGCPFRFGCKRTSRNGAEPHVMGRHHNRCCRTVSIGSNHHHSRCTSMESLQSADCSEITAITSLSASSIDTAQTNNAKRHQLPREQVALI